MLGPEYEGYNLQYTPERLSWQPEVGPIAFMGGRDPEGNPCTQPGVYFALNQRIFNFLLLNESAYVAFSAGGAPGVSGGSLNAGLDFDFGRFNVAGMVGLMGMRVVGATEQGPTFAGRIRFPVSNSLLVGVLYRWSNLEHFRTETPDASGTIIGRTGVTDASYIGFGITLR
jgi:opacity protein-like surface antigen